MISHFLLIFLLGERKAETTFYYHEIYELTCYEMIFAPSEEKTRKWKRELICFGFLGHGKLRSKMGGGPCGVSSSFSNDGKLGELGLQEPEIGE